MFEKFTHILNFCAGRIILQPTRDSVPITFSLRITKKAYVCYWVVTPSLLALHFCRATLKMTKTWSIGASIFSQRSNPDDVIIISLPFPWPRFPVTRHPNYIFSPNPYLNTTQLFLHLFPSYPLPQIFFFFFLLLLPPTYNTQKSTDTMGSKSIRFSDIFKFRGFYVWGLGLGFGPRVWVWDLGVSPRS